VPIIPEAPLKGMLPEEAANPLTRVLPLGLRAVQTGEPVCSFASGLKHLIHIMHAHKCFRLLELGTLT